MTIEDAKKELMVVHRDSPIGETHEQRQMKNKK